MKKWLIAYVLLFCISGCKNIETLEIPYDRQELKIAIIGDTPDIQNKNITFEHISLEELNNKVDILSSEFNAIMITPSMFVDASNDQFSEAYHNVEIPIVFWNSSKAHYPFVNNKINYLNEKEVSLNNIPHSMDSIEKTHSTIFLYDIETEKESVWFFHLNEPNELEKLYSEIFNKIEEVTI
ncbi:hypothetical protein [Solibacillus isronensis]|uniref:hypothetical protein n=1 Tax=Solibacillus isronensis TaxID=412383 RepID=UPI0009A8AF99|nr:hypothetical protein [Solibacillus isronensis]